MFIKLKIRQAITVATTPGYSNTTGIKLTLNSYEDKLDHSLVTIEFYITSGTFS